MNASQNAINKTSNIDKTNIKTNTKTTKITPSIIETKTVALYFDILIESRETCSELVNFIRQKVTQTYSNRSYHLLFIKDIDVENASISYGEPAGSGLWLFHVLASATVLQYNVGDVVEIAFQIKSKDKDNIVFYGTHDHLDCTILTNNLSDIIYFTDARDASIQFKINGETRRVKNNQNILVTINEIQPSYLQIGFGHYLRASTHIV